MYSIQTQKLDHIYNKRSPFEVKALDNISFSIKKGDIVGFIGHTGSGKSTLAQHLNALLKPTNGKIIIDSLDTMKKANLLSIRKKIGLVFQYPEYQLFEETVKEDIMFGPKQLKISDNEIEEYINNACNSIGLNLKEFGDRSPFELSGGEKRKVAIAGVLAMDPEIVIFDEPTSGLDPYSRNELIDNICKLSKENNKTIIIISHSMELMCSICNNIIVLDKGKLVMHDSAEKVFSKTEKLKSLGLDIPYWLKICEKLEEKGFKFNKIPLTIDEFAEEFNKIAVKK